MRLMGEMAEGGFGLPRNEKTALFWYRKGTEGGNREAMQRLASACREGALGLPADPVQAKRWEDKATEAAGKRESLLPVLTVD